jgi:site-specific recombinase XerD
MTLSFAHPALANTRTTMSSSSDEVKRLRRGVAHPASAQRTEPKLLDRVREAVVLRLLEDGYDIRTVQELLGHADVRTPMIDTHVLNRGALGVRSPADRL